MNKKRLRAIYSEKRFQLTEMQMSKLSEQILEQFQKSDLLHYSHYHLFLPILKNNEVNSRLLLHELWNANKEVYASKVEKKSLIHFPLREKTKLRENNWGILEPVDELPLIENELQQIEVIFIPLFVADKTGHRVGYGRGYYDRFLAQIPNAKKIGLSFFPPIEEIVDIEIHDISLDVLITPDKIYTFPPRI